MNPIDTRQILNWDQVKVHLQPNLCIECSLIPQQPLQCYRCQKLLCQICHQDLKQKSRGPKIFCQKCKALNYFNPANNSIYQSYRDMVIACVNRRYGCKVTLDYKKYQKHVEECDYQRIPCPSPGCFVTTLKRAKGDHLSVCEYVVENCQFCTKQFNRKSMAYHQEKCNGKESQQIDLVTLKSDFLKLRNRLDAAITQFEQSADIALLEDSIIEEYYEYKLMSYQQYDSLRSRRMAFSLHKQRLSSIKGYEEKQLSGVIVQVERMRSQSLNRRKQVEQQQLWEENSRMKMKLIEIANEKKITTQQVKLCQAKQKLSKLLTHQQHLMENLILMKKITNVTPTVSHRIQQQDYHLSKLKQMDHYLKDEDRIFLRQSILESPLNFQTQQQQTKTLDTTHLRLSELRLFSNGQLLQ